MEIFPYFHFRNNYHFSMVFKSWRDMEGYAGYNRTTQNLYFSNAYQTSMPTVFYQRISGWCLSVIWFSISSIKIDIRNLARIVKKNLNVMHYEGSETLSAK